MTPPPLFTRLAALADPTRARLLLAVERQELAVNELRAALQLPQSTVSRHLKLLADEGWVTSRADGTTNWYRLASQALDDEARQLWKVVRDQLADSPAARRDAERIRSIVAERQSRSREFFATSAGQWDRLRSELFGPGIETLALSCLLEPDWTVGDLGAGTGQLTATMAPLVTRVIAVDESPAMLDAARLRIGDAGNVDLRQGALEALPIDDASLDLALIVLVLHHLAAPDRAIEEAGRVLRPGGRLVIVDMLPHERSEYRQLMGHQWPGFDADTIADWCAAARLTDLIVRPLRPDPEAQGPLLFGARARKS